MATLKGLPDNYLECRYNRHMMRLLGYYRDEDMIVAVKKCVNCGMKKYGGEDVDGHRLSYVVYSPPEGYYVRHADGGRVEVSEVRKEMRRRIKKVYGNRDRFERATGE